MLARRAGPRIILTTLTILATLTIRIWAPSFLIWQAYQDSMRVLRLASSEGALFIACATFICDLDLYDYR